MRRRFQGAFITCWKSGDSTGVIATISLAWAAQRQSQYTRANRPVAYLAERQRR
jgi:hypothetical protein